MLATGLCIPLPMMQPPRARGASWPCPTPPLPCACRGRRSRMVSPPVVQCCSLDPPQQLHVQRVHAWHWRPAGWPAGWLAGVRAHTGEGGAVVAASKPGVPQHSTTQHNTTQHTPPPSPAAQAAPEPASTSCELQPGTPLGDASPHRGRRGDSSSSEEGVHTGDEQHGTGMPLLGAKTDRSALPGLRQRRGHHEGG